MKKRGHLSTVLVSFLIYGPKYAKNGPFIYNFDLTSAKTMYIRGVHLDVSERSYCPLSENGTFYRVLSYRFGDISFRTSSIL